MTWLGNPDDVISEKARLKLEEERAKIVTEIRILDMTPIPKNRPALTRGRQDDLINLAKKIKAIDKKLGRAGWNT
jgi:hypothetical protein